MKSLNSGIKKMEADLQWEYLFSYFLQFWI